MNERTDQSRRARSGLVTAPPHVRAAMHAALVRDGVRAASALGIGESTAARIACGLAVRRGSVLVAARALGLEVDDGR